MLWLIDKNIAQFHKRKITLLPHWLFPWRKWWSKIIHDTSLAGGLIKANNALALRTPDLHASNKAKLSQTLNPVTEGLTFAAMAMGLRVCPSIITSIVHLHKLPKDTKPSCGGNWHECGHKSLILEGESWGHFQPCFDRKTILCQFFPHATFVSAFMSKKLTSWILPYLRTKL
jgi:hypothetical protein